MHKSSTGRFGRGSSLRQRVSSKTQRCAKAHPSLISWHKGELTELLYLLLKQRQYFTFTSDIHRVKENVRGATPFPLSTVLLAHKISISQNVQ